MTMTFSRRRLLATGAAGMSALFLGPVPAAFAQQRALSINTLASTAAINVPMQYALQKGLAQFDGFAAAEVRPTARIPQIAQEVIAGASDMGDADFASTLTAAEAGADLRILGLSYSNTSQVIVVNGDLVSSIEEIAERNGTIAVNSIGDFMYVMLIGVLDKRGIDPASFNFIEMGSSGDRARALVAGRVDAVPMHVEQAAALAKQGNYKVLIRPWEEYDNWLCATIISTGAWLEKEENKAATVAVLKAVLDSFRKTNSDFDWYKAQVQEFASSNDLRALDDDSLRPIWETLSKEIHAFPDNMETLTKEAIEKVIPAYKAAGLLEGTPDIERVLDLSYLQQAIDELG